MFLSATPFLHLAETVPGISPLVEAAERRLEARRARRRRERRLAAELSSLSDHDLAELGVFRCDIPRIARDAYRDA